MSEWKEYRLGDICEIFAGGDAPKGRYSKIKTNKYNIPIYSNGITDEGLYGYTDKARVLTPATTITARGTIGVVFRRKEPYFPIVRLISIIGNKELLDSDFLYYRLKATYIDGEGSVQAQLTVPMISNYKIYIPSLSAQRRIASILSSLDDKIAINRRICENLEAQAQALFKHWFIDFAPFKDGQFVESELGMIPEGWRVYTLGEICKCELGGTPSRANKSYWGGNIAWINSGEVNKFRICEASEYITEEGLNHSATKLLPVKTTVLAITGATLGQVSLLEIDSCANQSVVGVKENSKIPYTFIYPAIKSKIKELVNMQTGGAQQHINKDNIQSLKIVLPPQKIMEEYKSISLHLYEEIGNLCFENLRLSTLRDTLLPKLMSGEIKV